MGSFASAPNRLLTPNLAGYAPPAVSVAQPLGPIVTGDDEEDWDEDEEKRINAANFSLDWRSFVPEHTPLRRYLDLVCTDDSPEEYHFWNFMSLIGLVCGKKVFLPDTKPVYGNLLTCIIGRTGQQKSRSEGFVADLLERALPFNEKDHFTNGIKVIKNPGSGEYLAAQFLHEVPDPATAPNQRGKQKMLRNPGVKALIRWPEMATMVGKSAGKGSIIQQTVIELYDVPKHIGGGSLTNGAYGADNPFGSVATTTQLKAIRNLVSTDDAASGFLNRWLFIIGRSKTFQPFGEIIDVSPLVPDVKAMNDWAEAKFRDNHGWHQMTNGPHGSAQAAADFLTNVAFPLQMHESEMLARSVLTFKKLILLFSANMMEDKVSIAAVEQAKVAFMYLTDCLKHIGVRVALNPYDELETLILELCSREDGITPRDLRRATKRRNADWTTEITNRLLKILEESEMIELKVVPQPANRPGRPLKRYFISEE